MLYLIIYPSFTAHLVLSNWKNNQIKENEENSSNNISLLKWPLFEPKMFIVAYGGFKEVIKYIFFLLGLDFSLPQKNRCTCKWKNFFCPCLLLLSFVFFIDLWSHVDFLCLSSMLLCTPVIFTWPHPRGPIIYFIEGRSPSRHKRRFCIYVACAWTFPWRKCSVKVLVS